MCGAALPADLITRRLAAVQPGLGAVMVVPPLWVPLAAAATSNFVLPVVVVPGSDGQGVQDALAACTLAVCNGNEVRACGKKHRAAWISCSCLEWDTSIMYCSGCAYLQSVMSSSCCPVPMSGH